MGTVSQLTHVVTVPAVSYQWTSSVVLLKVLVVMRCVNILLTPLCVSQSLNVMISHAANILHLVLQYNAIPICLSVCLYMCVCMYM